MSRNYSPLPWCQIVRALGLDIGSAVKQQTDRGIVSTHCSFMQRCPAVVVLGLDFGFSVEQQADRGLVPTPGSLAQRCSI